MKYGLEILQNSSENYMIKILTIIPTYNRLFSLKNLLYDFEKQNYLKNEIKLDICIVVDGSTDGTIEYLDQFKEKLKIILGDGNLWFTKSLNLGIYYAIEGNYDFILTINDDSRINSDYIEKLVKSIINKGNNSIVGSLALSSTYPHKLIFGGSYSFNKIIWKAKNYFPTGTILSKEKLRGIKPTKILTTRGTIFPLKLVKEIGKLNEKLIQYGSDDEFFLRALDAGYELYINYESVVYDDDNLTCKETKSKNPSLINYIKSLFNPYSSNYILNSLYLYFKFSYKILIPFYLIILIMTHLKYIIKRFIK